MQEERKPDVLKRLSYIEGHVAGIRKMVEEDKYCVDILRQTYAVRKAIEKLEALILEGHLRTCVPEGMKGDREEEVIQELVQLYAIAGQRRVGCGHRIGSMEFHRTVHPGSRVACCESSVGGMDGTDDVQNNSPE